MTTLTDYLAQVKERLEKANPDGCLMSRATHFSYDFADNCMDDLSKLIRICEIQRKALNEIMCVRLNNPQIDLGDLALHNNKVSRAAIQASDEIASEK